MEINKVRVSDSFGGRLDPHQFHPERLDMIHRIYSTGSWCKLKEVVCNVKSTTSLLTSKDIYIGLENIASNTGEYTQTTGKDSISSAAVFKKGDILFPKLRPYLNKVHRAEFAGKCSTEFHVFEAKNVDADYLTIILRSNMVVAQTKHLMTGNTLPRLQTADIGNIIIPLPAIHIQKEIVKLYAQAQNIKYIKDKDTDNLLGSINNYMVEQLSISTNTTERKLSFSATISNIIDARRIDPIFYRCNIQRFGTRYKLASISSVSVDIQSGFGAGKEDQADSEIGTIQLRPTNIDSNGNLIFERNVYVPSNLNKPKLALGDVLFNNTNSQELVGKTGLLSESKELFFSNHITRIRVNTEKVFPEYLKAILNLYQKENVFYSICTNWNNQSGVGIELLKSLKIPVPPIEKQREIVDHISLVQTKVKQLKKEGMALIVDAKSKIEKMILK